MPSTSPIRSRTTRTPRRCAFLASRSQVSQTRCVKQRLPPSNSVSVSSCHRPYQPIAEPLTTTAGRCCKRAISRLTARVMRRRDDRILRRLRRVHSALPIGSPARLITASIRASSGICARLGDNPQRRPQRRRLGRIARENRHVVARAGQRFDQTAADEAGRAGDQHMLPVRQRIDQRRRIAGRQPPHAPRRHEVAQPREHDADRRQRRDDGRRRHTRPARSRSRIVAQPTRIGSSSTTIAP